MVNKIRNEDLRLNIIVNGDAGRAEIIKLEESMADAKNSIQALKDKQKELADQGKKTSKEYSELTKEFDSKTLAYKKQVAEYNSYLRLQNLEKLSLKELKSLHRATKVAFDNSSRGTDQYNKSLIELQKITAQIDKFKKAVSSEVTELRLLESTLADSEVTLKAYREAQSEMSAQGKESSSEYEAITKSIDEQSIALDKNRARYEELVAEHGTVQLSLKELKNRQKETSNAMEAAVPDSEEFIELRTEFNSLTAQIDKVNSSVAESEEVAQRNLDSVNKEIETYDQFESTLADAEKEVRSLKKEQSELIRAGKQNTPEYAKLTKEIDRQSDSLSEQRAKYKELLRQQDLTKLSLKELKHLYRDTKRIFDDSTPGTAAYKKLRSELDALNQQMKVVDVTSVEMGKTMNRSFNSAAAGGSVLKRTFNTINTKVGGMMAAGAALFGITSALERANEQFRELDEAQVDTMKTTGLTTTGVDDLSDSLAQIDTRTPQNELLAIGRIAGKLGVQGKKDILEFTEAADMITVALGDDLGGDVEEVITQVGKLNDIFGLNEQYGYGESMLKVASTLNELGMASTAAEGYLVDFSKRVAGTAPNVDISIQSILGLGATLDKFGITSEVAGTTYGQVIAGMYKKTETFAGIAKMGIGEFKTLMDEDMNEAFIRVMENMGGGDMELIVKSLKDMGLDGQRAQEVLGVLANNTGELRRQQEIANTAFADGTSILNEFNIKNDSATARYEKHQKAMTALSIELGKTLNPAMESSRSVMRGSMEVLIALVKWFYKYKAVILGVGAAIVGYKVAEIAITRVIKIGRGMRLAYLLVVRATTTATIAQTTATKAATIATKLFSLAIKMTPLGWIAVILGAVAGGFAAYALSSTKAARAQRILNDVNTKASEIEDEHGRSLVGKAEEMRLLMEAIENTTTSENSRNDAIKRLQELMPDGINMINEETIASGKAAEAVKGHTEQLILQAQIKAALKLREEAFDKYAQDTVTGEDGDLGFWQTLGSKTISLGIPIIEMVIAGQMSANNRKDAKQALEDDIAGYNKIIADAQAELKAQGIDVDSDGDPTDDPDSKPTTTTDTDWSLSNDEAYLKSRQKLKQQYLDGEIQTEEEYNDQLLALEIKSLQDRLAITDKGSEEQIKVQGELTDKLIDQKKRDAKRKEQAEIKERKDNSDLLNDAEATIKAQQQQFEAEKEVKSKQHKEDLLFFKGTDKERRELRQQQMQEQKDLEQKHLEEVATQLEGIIGEGLFDDIKIDTSLLSEEEIGIVDQYRESGLVEDYEHGGLDKDESGNYVLDLANTLPSTSCVDFVKDILNALCATIFISPLGIEIVDNKSTVLSGDFIDWTSRIDDHHTIQWEQGQGYECGYAGISEPEEIEEPVSISSNMEGCFDAANLTMVKHLYTDDIYKRTTATVKFGDSSKAPIVRDIPLLSTCRQGRMFVPELAQTDRDVYSAKSNLTPVTTQPIVHYVEYTSSSLLKYRYVAPIIAIPEVGGSRPTDVYFGMLHQNRVPPGGVGSQAPYLQMSTNGVIGGNGWTGAWQGLWEEREESFTMTGSGGIYETFHKDFAEWLAIDKTIFQFELNLTAQDIYNLQLWRKVMLRNKLFFIKNLNITLNTSNSSITTEGEFVKAETL